MATFPNPSAGLVQCTMTLTPLITAALLSTALVFLMLKTEADGTFQPGTVTPNKIVDRFCELVYKVTSDNGAHTTYQNPKYPPTRYTVQAVICAMLDLILWSRTASLSH